MTDHSTSPDTTELLPCPFCGQTPEFEWKEWSGVTSIWCANDDCDCGCETSASSLETAKEAWNTRASQPATPTGGEVDLTNHHNALKCPYCNPQGLEFAPAQSSAGIGELVQQLREKAEWREDDVHGDLHREAADALERLHAAAQAAPIPAIGFCQWLKGYFSSITGRDELTAFEANTIRAELYEKVFPSTPLSSTDRGEGEA